MWDAGALGKAIVALVEPERRAAPLAGELPRLTGRTITNPKEPLSVLEEVAADGPGPDPAATAKRVARNLSREMGAGRAVARGG
jgi:DNA-binding IclR family transcriptional regulator